MKKLITLVSLALCVLSANVYAEAQFEDVKKNDWFYGGVSAAKESGLMNGVSDTQFAPSATLSVEQGVTVAARIHSLYTDKTIPSDFQGYGYYMDYAVEKGIVPQGYFDDTGRPIKRKELSYIIDNSLDGDILEAKNDVKFVPDADIGSEYYDGLLRLYNAGILGGFDEYGSFLPDNNLTRAELAVVLDRILHKESRISNSFVDGTNKEAFYLIDDFLMKTSVRSIPDEASGWRYDYTGDSGINSTNAYQNVLKDEKTDDHVSMKREIYPQFSGEITLELVYTLVSGTDGARFYFTDVNGKELLEIFTANEKIFVKGEDIYDTGVASVKGKTTLKCVLDIDGKSVILYVNGVYSGQYKTVKSFDGAACLHAATTDGDMLEMSVDNVHLYKNYLVNDVFRIDREKAVPQGYEITGSLSVERTVSDNEKSGDLQAVKITADASSPSKAYKAFTKHEAIDSTLCFESYVLLPDGENGAYVSLKNGSTDVIKLCSKDGQWVCGGKNLRAFSKNIWQLLRIEANLKSGKAVIKINGKTVAQDIAFDAKSFDGIEIGFAPDKSSVMWFDDVEVKRLYEYPDYVPVPKVLETDYILSMMVCSLWRNGSHYGWDYISPFEEITPVTGYYDEGNPEEADWEIKFLTEHGFSDYHLCWYAPASNANEPIKKPRMSDSLHDGFFNAKYSDLLSFSIMWENAGYTDNNIDNFKNNIWKYWCEWYFTDDRYLKIDGKPFLSIYQINGFYEMCSKSPSKTRELLQWMHEDIKNYGFEDIIIAFSSNGRLKNENVIFNSIGITDIHTYSWGSGAGMLDINKTMVDTGYTTAAEFGINAIGVASPGLNTYAWNKPRTAYLNPSEFEKLLTWFRDDYLTRFPKDSWHSKLIMFDNWNEFGEGHYLYPANIGGFGYLDAAARVFGKDAFDDSVNVFPTVGQKRRIGTLFPAVTMHLKREQKIPVPVIKPESAVRTFDFTKPETAPKFTTSNMRNYGYNAEKSAFVFEAITADPIMWYGKQTERAKLVSAKDVDVIHIRMKSEALSQGQIFFVTDEETNWDEAKSFKFEIENTDEFVDYYVDTKSNTKWKDEIYGIRFDPHTVGGAGGEIEVFEFMKYPDEYKSFEITVDGKEVTVLRDEVRQYDRDEMYYCFKHESGIFTLLLTSYEWNRNTGVLKLDTKYGTKLEFTVGSDRVLVDGKSVKLDKKVEKYDGTVVLPVKFLLDRAGYDYVYAPDRKSLEVFVNIQGQEKVDFEEAMWNGEKTDGGFCMKTDVSLDGDCVYILDFDIKAKDGKNVPVTVSFEGEKDVTVDAGAVDGKEWVHISCKTAVPAGKVNAVTVAASGYEFSIENTVIHKRPKPFQIKNGDAEGEDTAAFYSTALNKNTVEAVTDPLDASNKVWYVKNLNTASQSWSYIRHDAFYEKGVTYEVEFDVRIDALSDGRPVSGANVVVNPRYYDINRIGVKNPHDHVSIVAKGIASSNEWTHIKKTFTISDGISVSDEVKQQFTIYVEPVDGLGVSFYIDNVTVRVP